MPEQKHEVVIKRWGGGDGFDLWFDGTVQDLLEIEGIAGGTVVEFDGRPVGRWQIWVDPRYDIEEVMAEVQRRFTTPIPDAFKDALEDT